jgi:Tol biopolymer transport system component
MVAFTSNRSGSLDIWVMDADGSDPVNLSGGVGAEDQEPSRHRAAGP